MDAILRNPTVDINGCDQETGVNAFWLAAYYGHGKMMAKLAQRGIDVTNWHKQTQSNAMHTAVEKNFPEIVQQLIDSHFPLDETKKGGLTALIISCNDEERFLITKLLVRAGADINIISEHGSSALSEAVNTKNHELVDILLKKGAFIYYPQEEWRD